MANSLTFNGTDLTTYNLVVLGHNMPAAQETKVIRVQNKGIAGDAQLLPADLSFEVIITGTSVSNVMSLVDSIRKVLNTRETAVLTPGVLSDRYWLAKSVSMTGDLLAQKYWKGTISFTAPDPLAYDLSETDNDYNIDADPDTVTETAGGTANAEPVYTLTAGENLVAATIKVKNETTGEELEWKGDIDSAETLEIDTEHWTVKLNGTDDMASVTGEFPVLIPGANSIKVTGFGILGSLNIIYRNRYL